MQGCRRWVHAMQQVAPSCQASACRVQLARSPAQSAHLLVQAIVRVECGAAKVLGIHLLVVLQRRERMRPGEC